MRGKVRVKILIFSKKHPLNFLGVKAYLQRDKSQLLAALNERGLCCVTAHKLGSKSANFTRCTEFTLYLFMSEALKGVLSDAPWSVFLLCYRA